jgi:hypothetical protein
MVARIVEETMSLKYADCIKCLERCDVSQIQAVEAVHYAEQRIYRSTVKRLTDAHAIEVIIKPYYGDAP